MADNSHCECGYRFLTVRHILSECRKFTLLRRETSRKRRGAEGVEEIVNPRLVQYTKKAAYFKYVDNRAFKAVPRHSGGTTMTASIAKLRLVNSM